MLTYKFFSSLAKNPQYNYNNEKVVQLIIQSKFSKSEQSKQNKKIELFYMMHQIILMHLDIFKVMCSRDFDHSDENSAFQRDDLISEFYIVFERCVLNYDLSKRDKKNKRINFYFYYKKSLMWCIQRLYHFHKKKLQDTDQIGWDSDWKYDTQSSEMNPDFIDFLMDKWGLVESEKDLINSKLEGLPIKDYIEQTGISSSDYYKQMQLIKDKIQKQIYEGNFIHDPFVMQKWFQDIGIGRENGRSVVLAGDKLPNPN